MVVSNPIHNNKEVGPEAMSRTMDEEVTTPERNEAVWGLGGMGKRLKTYHEIS